MQARSAVRVVVALLLAALAACTSDTETPEARVRAVVDGFRSAVESRSLQDAAAFLHPAYSDRRHADKRGAVASLFAYLRRHRRIHLFTLVRGLEIAGDGRSADARVFVAMGAVPLTSIDTVIALRADLYRFDIGFVLEGGEWLVRQAAWQRVGPEAVSG